MGKLLSWVLLIVLGWAIWKLVVITQRKQQARHAARGQPVGADSGERGAAEPRAVGQGELMVRCAHCGIHFPQSEALAGGEHRFCSPAHRAAGPRDHERARSDPAP